MTTVRIDQVSKVFRTGSLASGFTAALRQVSFDIDVGEVVTLIGESGSGKSTLGKIVLRLLSPTSGRVLFDEQDIAVLRRAGLSEYYRHVQGVFQDPFSSYNPIYKADRVFEMIRGEYFGHLARPDWQAKLEAALEDVSLNPGDVLNKYPHQLSGGQLQRLLIARALLLDVKLLVADEVISMLDASTRVDVLNLLVDLKRKGLAILFITHDLSLGNYVSDRTVILRQGAIAEMGPTTAVFGNPQHPYTRMLLESVPQLHKKWHGHGAAVSPVAAVTPAGVPAAGRVTTGRARAGGGRVPAAMLTHPELVECGPGHLVAQPED